MIEFDASTTRRLPVYLLLDTSGSMIGDGIEAVNQGVQLLLTELKNDPIALETAWVSCVTFANEATEILSLTEIGKASIPYLNAGGNTNLGAALRLLLDKLDHEVRPNTPEQKGDYKPLIFLMTDARPNDSDWSRYASNLREQANRRTANVIALACGHNFNAEVLKQITPTVLQMPDVTPDVIKSFFKWVSQSVRVTSKTAASGPSPSSGPVDLPPLPSGIQVVL